MNRGLLTFLLVFAGSQARAEDQPQPLRVIIMDPLSAPLSCACVKGFGQRDYRALALRLVRALKRPVKLVHAESLDTAFRRAGRGADVIIGKESVVRVDATRHKLKLSLVGRLSDQKGATDLRGVIIVPKNHTARKIADLAGKQLALGPAEDRESHEAAVEELIAAGLFEKVKTKAHGSTDDAAYAVADGETDAAVVPEYLPMLLEACGKVDKGSLRVIHKTKPVPFVAAFVTDAVSQADAATITRSLLTCKDDRKLLTAIESKAGFVAKPAKVGWTDWRGKDRLGRSEHVPQSLPKKPTEVWSAKLTGPALAGIAATEKYVVVADKDAELKHDLFRCFNAKDGEELWRVKYAAAKSLDYSNAPRACPVIHAGRVFLHGALGDLRCVELSTGKTIWKRNIVRDFGGQLITWGSSSPPLVVDDKLIINPGAAKAALVALDWKTGKVKWQTPGNPAAYAAFILWTVHGQRQIVGYDAAGLGGWDPKTGKRLWEIIPPGKADFNVGTPLPYGNSLVVATENNATRQYLFQKNGKPIQKPIAVNDDLAPDTSSPVIINDRLFCTAYGSLFCLDMKNKLKTIWSVEDDLFFDHCNLIAGNNRVLIWTTDGNLLLIAADGAKYNLLSKWTPFTDRNTETMSHPAIVGDRIYVRSKTRLLCLKLQAE